MMQNMERDDLARLLEPSEEHPVGTEDRRSLFQGKAGWGAESDDTRREDMETSGNQSSRYVDFELLMWGCVENIKRAQNPIGMAINRIRTIERESGRPKEMKQRKGEECCRGGEKEPKPQCSEQGLLTGQGVVEFGEKTEGDRPRIQRPR
eukprot:g4011.t1